jgi:Restriction endonuclease S subunits
LNTAGCKIEFYDNGYPIIQSRNLENGMIDIDKKIKFMSEKDWLIYKDKYKPKIGDVFLTNIGTIGKTAVVTEEQEYLIHWNIFILKLNHDLIKPFYLKYFLDTPYCFNYYKSFQKGGTVNFITKKMIEILEIPLPPLPEQKRIVAILDKAFAAIVKVKANAEQNLKNTKELFESYLQVMFENKGEDWEEKTLGDLNKNKNAVVSGPFGSNLKVSDYKESGVPILRLQNIGKGYFVDQAIKYITETKAEELKYHSYNTGDIVLAKLGKPIGKTCIVPDKFFDGIITADVVRIRPDPKIVNYKFVEYFLNTNLSVSQLTSNISGATRPRVNLSDVRNIILYVPSLKEQKQIVQKLDALSAETKNWKPSTSKK